MTARRIHVTESYRLTDSADVGTVRRGAVEHARALELDSDAVALCVTELATNQLLHGGGGIMQLWADGQGLELVSVQLGSDQGGPPGLGAGLHSVRRFASVVNIDAVDGAFVVRARFGAVVAEEVGFAVLLMPLDGYRVSGDGVLMVEDERGWSCVVIDVLGHGPAAAADRDRLLASLDGMDLARPTVTLRAANEAMQGRRGAAMQWINVSDGRLRSFGIGNVRATVLNAERSRTLPNEHGIVGRHPRAPRVHEAAFDAGSRLVISSDGINTKSRARVGGSLFTEAARLLREHRRPLDDCTVVLMETQP